MNMQALMKQAQALQKDMTKAQNESEKQEFEGESSVVKVKITTAAGAQAEKEYKIVGSNETNPLEGKISDESAVGKALIGHGVGEVVEVEVPAGMMKYEVLSISK